MIGNCPDFIDSPYLIIDEKGWRLKKDAPKELKEKYNEYMESLKTENIIKDNN